MRLGDFAVVDRYKKRRAEIEARYKNLNLKIAAGSTRLWIETGDGTP
jgi:hypothetical protein